MSLPTRELWGKSHRKTLRYCLNIILAVRCDGLNNRLRFMRSHCDQGDLIKRKKHFWLGFKHNPIMKACLPHHHNTSCLFPQLWLPCLTCRWYWIHDWPILSRRYHTEAAIDMYHWLEDRIKIIFFGAKVTLNRPIIITLFSNCI